MTIIIGSSAGEEIQDHQQSDLSFIRDTSGDRGGNRYGIIAGGASHGDGNVEGGKNTYGSPNRGEGPDRGRQDDREGYNSDGSTGERQVQWDDQSRHGDHQRGGYYAGPDYAGYTSNREGGRTGDGRGDYRGGGEGDGMNNHQGSDERQCGYVGWGYGGRRDGREEYQ